MVARHSLTRPATLLAVNLLYLMVWGFAGGRKVQEGVPAWFGEKFGPTLLGKFPGPTATFWLLTVAELVGLGLALLALGRAEFLARRRAWFLEATLVWSLFVFLALGFGQWLTFEYNGAFQQFLYFAATLVALRTLEDGRTPTVSRSAGEVPLP